jgi:RHS repeat-associated protein
MTMRLNRTITALLFLVSLAGVVRADDASKVNPPSATAPRHGEWTVTGTYWDSGQYLYDGSGNIAAIGDDRYTYDELGRLHTATAIITPSHADNSQTFTYDRYGNLLTIDTTSGGHASQDVFFVESTKNQLSTTGTCPPTAYCHTGVYDDAGNQFGAIAGVREYQWDGAGMMTALTLSSRQEEYVYDANDERIVAISTIGGNQRYTLRGADNKVARELVYNTQTATWTWSHDYVYRDGVLLAEFVPGEPGTGPHRHYHVDHLGTPRVITDSAGNRLSLHTYWPFGAEAPGSETDVAEHLQFTGHERDSSPGAPGYDLDYMHARYYWPGMGRFLSVDRVSGKPERPQSWNRYSYVLNNPMAAVDPTGLSDKDVIRRATFSDMMQSPEHFNERYMVDETTLEMKLKIPFVIASLSFSLQMDHVSGESTAKVKLKSGDSFVDFHTTSFREDGRPHKDAAGFAVKSPWWSGKWGGAEPAAENRDSILEMALPEDLGDAKIIGGKGGLVGIEVALPGFKHTSGIRLKNLLDDLNAEPAAPPPPKQNEPRPCMSYFIC